MFLLYTKEIDEISMVNMFAIELSFVPLSPLPNLMVLNCMYGKHACIFFIFYFFFVKKGEGVSKFEKCREGETRIYICAKQATPLFN